MAKYGLRQGLGQQGHAVAFVAVVKTADGQQCAATVHDHIAIIARSTLLVHGPHRRKAFAARCQLAGAVERGDGRADVQQHGITLRGNAGRSRVGREQRLGTAKRRHTTGRRAGAHQSYHQTALGHRGKYTASAPV